MKFLVEYLTDGDRWFVRPNDLRNEGGRDRREGRTHLKGLYRAGALDYHLDTCFAPLSKGHYLWYPRAFSTSSYWSVAMQNGRSSGVYDEEDPAPYVADMLIDVDETDAEAFACNVVCIDDTVIVPQCSDKVLKALEQRGYNPVVVDMSEFIKAGGAAKCLTLQIA